MLVYASQQSFGLSRCILLLVQVTAPTKRITTLVRQSVPEQLWA